MGAIKSALLRAALAAVFSVCALGAARARAEDYSSAAAFIHTFNNGVTVYTGVFALNRDVNLDTSVYFKYNVDMINPSLFEGGNGGGGDSLTKGANSNVAAVSGASSAVSAGGVQDTRHELNAGITHNFNNLFGVETYLDYSHEKDYTSLTPSVTITRDLFDKNTTISIGYSRNFDRISGQFIGSTESRDTDNYYVGLTQVLSPVTIARIGYARTESSGLEIEGIRLVPINGVTLASCTALSADCVNESVPSSRSRNSYMAGLSHYFITGPGFFGPVSDYFDRSAIKLFLRYYDDDWSIKSYTAEVEWDKYLRPDLILGLNYRFYNQSKAFFVKDAYTAADQYKTVSPQLLSFDSHLVGAKLTYKLKDASLTPGVRLGTIEGKYQFYAQSSGVNAHILMAVLNFLF